MSALAEAGAKRIALGPLGDAAVEQVALAVLGTAPSERLLGWALGAGGNPLYVSELLRCALEDNSISLDGDRAVLRSAEVPSGLRVLLERRLTGLPAETLECLELGSVLGSSFAPDLLADLKDASTGRILGALKEAIQVGILRDRGDALAFRHDVLREVVYDRIPPAVRSALHVDAARVLLARRAAPAIIAAHLLRGARDPAAVPMLVGVAAELGARTPAPAAELLGRALELMPPTDPDRPRTAVGLVRLLALSGRAQAAAERAQDALSEGLDIEAEARLRIGFAEAMAMQGRSRAVLEQLEQAQRLPGLSDHELAPLLGTVAHARLFVGELSESETAAAAGLRAAERVGDQAAACWALMARSIALLLQARLDPSLQAIGDAVRRADRGSPEARLRQPRLFLAPTLSALNRFDDADRVFVAGRRQAESLGTVFSLPAWLTFRASMLRSLGRFDEAIAEAEAAVQIADELGTRTVTLMAFAILAEIALHRNDFTTAGDWLQRGWELVRDGVDWTAQHLLWSNVLLAHTQGDHNKAITRLDEGPLPLSRRIDLIATDHSVGPAIVRIALSGGANNIARQVHTLTGTAATLNPAVCSLAAAADQCHGLIAHDRHALERAVDGFRESRRQPAHAAACEDAARANAADGDRASATALLRQAQALYENMDAHADIARVDDALRSLGVRRRRTTTAAADATGWQALTPTEQKIAALVAEGLSNPQIATRQHISRHTVESHLKHIYPKLGINSRVELATVTIQQQARPRSQAKTSR